MGKIILLLRYVVILTSPFFGCTALMIQTDNKLFSNTVYDNIQSGKISVIPNFLSSSEVSVLRREAQRLHSEKKFSTDALASYGTSGKFDPSKDRAVLRLTQWKDQTLGDYDLRQQFGYRMASVRSDLAYNLQRPYLDTGLATTKYGYGSTEISFTRFGPGAFLRRHVDEHHEELKGKAGWSQPTRRSVSWLIYLNEDDWDGTRDGGQLRCFHRKSLLSSNVGARPNGDLQLGWLRASNTDPVERPVFLDGRRPNHKCAMYVMQNNNDNDYITKDFDTHPLLYVAGSEALTKSLLMNHRRDCADRFHLIETPKNKLDDLFKRSKNDYVGLGENPQYDETVNDIDPLGGTLVLFDSVSLPHEVLASRKRERWATSGWFHEDQQQPITI